jgi:myo-inositol 2-dehydrogenase / D-chiro-inositol 1-dehydrogenase
VDGIFRLGVAGAGRMGRNHIKAIAGSDKVRVVSIAEPGDAARAGLAGTEAAVYGDLDSMLAAGGLDGVLVCVPSDLHLRTVSRLVDAGLPVLCEKPCGVTQEEAKEATRLAAEASLPLQIGFWRRFVPALQELRRRVADGQLGGVYLVACYQWDGAPPGPSFRAHSGGIFIDMGVHEFDQARWLTGQEFGAISALPSGVAAEPWPGDPESAQALAAMSGGTTAIVSLGRRFPLGDVCKVEVYGTRDWEEVRFLWPPDADEVFMAAVREQAESFARYAAGGSLEGAGGRDVTQAVIAAQSAAAASGRS